MEIVLWNMSYALDADRPNLGDVAIVWSLLKTLNEKISPTLSITLFCSSKEVGNSLPKTIDVNLVEYKIKNFHRVLKAILSCNFFIVAGGEFLSDRYHSLYSIFNLIPVFLARLFSKKIIAYAIGVDDPSHISPLAKALAKIIFHREAEIIVRDTQSRNAVLQIGLKSNVYITTDAVVGLAINEQLDDLNNVCSKENIVIIAPRLPLRPFKGIKLHPLAGFLPTGMRIRRGILPDAYLRARRKFVKGLAQVVKYLYSHYNMKCLLLPMYSGRFSYDDLSICEEIRSLSSAHVVRNMGNPIKVLRLIKNAKLVIGVPLHSLIFATIVGTPFIGLPYHPKIVRFLTEQRLEAFYMNTDILERLINENGFSELLQKIDEIFHDFSLFELHLSERIEELKIKYQRNLDLLKRFLSSNLSQNSIS